MMVVPVLMTSCQVSEKSKTGPVPAHTATSTTASTNVAGLPAHSEVLLAKRVNTCCGVAMYNLPRYSPQRNSQGGVAVPGALTVRPLAVPRASYTGANW